MVIKGRWSGRKCGCGSRAQVLGGGKAGATGKGRRCGRRKKLRRQVGPHVIERKGEGSADRPARGNGPEQTSLGWFGNRGGSG